MKLNCREMSEDENDRLKVIRDILYLVENTNKSVT